MIALKIKPSRRQAVDKIFRREMKIALRESGEIMQREIIRTAPVGVTGRYKAGVKVKVIDQTRAEVGMEGVAKIYAPVVEHGRRPGSFPRVDKIRIWIQRTPRGQRILAAIARRYRLKPAAALKTAAYLIGRKIKQRGTRARMIFQKAAGRTEEKIIRRFEAAVKRIEQALR